MTFPFSISKLVDRGSAGLAYDDEGMTYGPLPVVYRARSPMGRCQYRVVSPETATMAFETVAGSAHAEEIDLFYRGLLRVAKALDSGNGALARIAAVQLRVPELSKSGFEKLRKLALLRKDNPDWADQPRNPAGESDGGQWSGDGNGSDESDQLAQGPNADLEAQHTTARNALSAVWKKSQQDRVEYGGFIYKNADGTYGTTSAVSGWTSGIS